MIAVHAGAGLQTDSNRSGYRNVCELACKAGLEKIKSGLHAVDAVTFALMALEDDPLTNAGLGSNLCCDGSIECDASLMLGDTLQWAGVGGVPGIKNPILIPRRLIQEQSIENPLGLIPPNFLVGEPAKEWAKSKGIATGDLITDRARLSYQKYKKLLDEVESGKNEKDGEDESARNKRNLENEDEFGENFKARRLDTVGAIAVDTKGRVAAGVSSGGILLKNPGRVGQAAVYGAGCWAENSIAITTSGSGEYLVKTLFAKECASYLLLYPGDDIAHHFKYLFKEKYTESPFLKDIKATKAAGILTLIHDSSAKRTELMWAHNTATMCLGYASLSRPSPRFVFSKHPGEPKGSPVIEALLI